MINKKNRIIYNYQILNKQRIFWFSMCLFLYVITFLIRDNGSKVVSRISVDQAFLLVVTYQVFFFFYSFSKIDEKIPENKVNTTQFAVPIRVFHKTHYLQFGNKSKYNGARHMKFSSNIENTFLIVQTIVKKKN